MRFFNSLGHRLEEFRPIHENTVGMYTCGPTVYNYAHIGNFRCYLFEDLLRRTLEYHGYKVTQVMNLTDVDDKTIRDSKAAGIPLRDFTRKYKDTFFEDVKTLRIEPATYYPDAFRQGVCVSEQRRVRLFFHCEISALRPAGEDRHDTAADRRADPQR